MSKIICSAAIRGAHKIVDRAEQKWKEAMDQWGSKQDVGFPNTAYYLPVIYGMTGIPVKTVGDMEQVLKQCRNLLPPPVREKVHLPYLAPALDAGMATFFAEEIIEAIRYLEDPDFYTQQEDPMDHTIWLGAADDIILRKRGIEFVDGTAPGFAAIAGAAPSPEVAARIAQELQEKNLYVFMCAEHEGKRFSEQLVEADVQIGWPTRLVSFGPDISAAVFAMGFATRVAMSFGGVEPGDFRRILIYNKDRTFAFVMPLGYVTEEWYANAAGAINWGFPTIADTPIPQVLPTGICTYEHVVSNVPHDQIVARAVEVRGLKVTVAEVPVPVAYGPAFEGERVRRDDVYAEARGGQVPVCEWVTSRRMDDVEDGKVVVIGPDLDDMPQGTMFPLAIVAEVAGREMQEDFEPILERQIHHLINYAQGVMHIGQRDIAWVRISKSAMEKGFRLKHIGSIIHAKLHQDFGRIFDKIQVKIYTEEDNVQEILAQARVSYHARDARIEGMTDETTETYYSCTLCVPKGEEVLLADGSFDRVENLIQTAVDQGEVHVLSFDHNDLVAKPVEELFINPAPTSLIRTELSNGHSLQVTPNHKVLVDTPEGLDWVQASQLKPGDVLLSSKGTTVDGHGLGREEDLYIIDLLPDDLKVFDDAFMGSLRESIRSRYDNLASAARDFGMKYRRLYYALYQKETDKYRVSHERLKLGEIKAIVGKLGLAWDEVKGEIRELGTNRKCKLSKKVLDEDLLYMAGLVASDGCVVRRGTGTFVQFTNCERVLIEKFNQSQYALFGVCPKTEVVPPKLSLSKGLEIRGKQEVMVSYVHNPLIGPLMMGLGIGIKGEDGEKWRGETISRLSPKLVAAYLRGLFDGDGHVTENHILISTGVYKEAQHIQLLLKKLGISSYTTRITRGYQVGTRSNRDFMQFRSLISSGHPGKRTKMEGVELSFDEHHVVRTDAVPLLCGSLIKDLIQRTNGSIEVTKLPVDYKTIEAWVKGKRRASKEKLRLFLDGVKPEIGDGDPIYQELLRWSTSKMTFEKIRKVERVQYAEREVYNFSVADTHNYFVNGLCVANCQSFAPNHVCTVSPERTGLCGAYNWMDCRAAYEINPTGPNQPIGKGECLDPKLGRWKGVDEFVYKASRGNIDHYYFYSVVYDPMTTCGCCECIAAVAPLCNGVMTVNREYDGMTPCGMKFTTLAGTIGGGMSTPGFVGHSKYNICQRKFIAGDGGIKRLVWMPKMLKEELMDRLKRRSEEIGIPNFYEMIADETVGVTEEEILPFLEEVGHPALTMDPIL